VLRRSSGSREGGFLGGSQEQVDSDGTVFRNHGVPGTLRLHHVTAVVGAAGSGKTALLETIAGMNQGTGRAIPIGEATWRQAVTFVLEGVPLLGHHSPTEAVQALLALSGSPFASRDDMRVALRLSDLPDALFGERTARLSRPHRLAVWLAFHRLRGARVLLVDAPLDGLSEGEAQEIGRQIRDVAVGGSAVVFTTRERDVAFRVGDEVIELPGAGASAG
jgi:ABC-type multidrug transport system ATPase subunit